MDLEEYSGQLMIFPGKEPELEAYVVKAIQGPGRGFCVQENEVTMHFCRGESE